MKKSLFVLTMLSVLLFSSCSKDAEYKYDDSKYEPLIIQYKIINKTDRNYHSIIFTSYKYKNDQEEFHLQTTKLKPNEDTGVLRTRYKHVRITCLYEKDLGEGMKPELMSKFYPSTYSLYELKEEEVNIIELK